MISFVYPDEIAVRPSCESTLPSIMAKDKDAIEPAPPAQPERVKSGGKGGYIKQLSNVGNILQSQGGSRMEAVY